jgi:hypothetical protein
MATYKIKGGMPQSRVFGGIRYSYWFHADTKVEANKLRKEFKTKKARIRIVKKSKGYDIYGRYL